MEMHTVALSLKMLQITDFLVFQLQIQEVLALVLSPEVGCLQMFHGSLKKNWDSTVK